MSHKVFVGSLSWGTDNHALEQAFSACGAIEEAFVVYDKRTGKSRGFGFVTFADADGMSKALSTMDGQELDGRNIHVNPAEKPSKQPPSTSDTKGASQKTSNVKQDATPNASQDASLVDDNLW